MLTLNEFKAARAVLSGVILNTNLIYSPALSKTTGNHIYLKPENMQVTGAYKIRGAYYKISTLSEEEKSRGLRSLNGIVGLECAFPVLYTQLVEPGVVPFATLLNALCVNPRRLFRLPGGKIEAGEIADLTVLDLNWPHAIDSTLFFSQGRSTPFDGWTVTAGVDKTICNGNLVYTASSRNINKTPIPPCQEDYL